MAVIKLAPAKNSEPEGNMSTFPGKQAWLLSPEYSEVVSGKDGGMLLKDYIEEHTLKCLGTKAEQYGEMPITIKLVSTENGQEVEIEQVAGEADEVSADLELENVSHDHHESEWLQDGSAKYECLEHNSCYDADYYELNGRMDMDADSHSFKALVFIDGSAVIDADGGVLHAEPGDTFFVEAGTYPFQITGNCSFVLVALV